MHWAAKYIGLPYRLGGREIGGLDCYGLLQLIYRVEKGVSLPDLPGVAEETTLAISREILLESCEKWIELPRPADGCAVALSQQSALHHVGVWTDADGGLVLHANKGIGVVAESLRFLKMKGYRTIRFFSYVLHR